MAKRRRVDRQFTTEEALEELMADSDSDEADMEMSSSDEEEEAMDIQRVRSDRQGQISFY